MRRGVAVAVLAALLLAAIQDPAGRRSPRVVTRLDLAERIEAGMISSAWKGLHYIGSDGTHHHFVDATQLRETRLTVLREGLKVEGESPVTTDRAKWIYLGDHDLRATTLPLVSGPRRVADPLRPHLPAAADQIPAYDGRGLAALVRTKPIGDGPAVRFELDVANLRRFVEAAEVHAASWPARFRSKADEEKARDEVRDATRSIGLVDWRSEVDPEVALLGARLETAAHNLEIEGAWRCAEMRFRALLARSPDHRDANRRYADLLAGSAVRCEDALRHYEIAAKLGDRAAERAMGLTWLRMGDKARALAQLRSYAAAGTVDAPLAACIAALEKELR